MSTSGNEGGQGSDGVVSSSPIVVAATAPTVQDYMASAPPEIRQVLEDSMRVHTARKEVLVKGILACATNTFTEPQLLAMDLAMLENVGRLAQVKSFQGMAVPTEPVGLTVEGAQQTARFASANTDFLNTPTVAPVAAAA